MYGLQILFSAVRLTTKAICLSERNEVLSNHFIFFSKCSLAAKKASGIIKNSPNNTIITIN